MSEESKENRRIQQQQAAKEAILKAASRVFLKDGYQKATMRGIAKEAGYTASSLYTYFPSKQDMLQELREMLHNKVLQAFSASAPKGVSFLQRLEFIILRLEETVTEVTELLLLYLAGRFETLDDSIETTLKRPRDFKLTVSQIISESADEKELNGHKPYDIACLFMGLINAQIKQQIELDANDTEALKQALRKAYYYMTVILSAKPYTAEQQSK